MGHSARPAVGPRSGRVVADFGQQRCAPGPEQGLAAFGWIVATAFDARFAAPNATFGFVFTRLGIVPEACSSWFLPRIVGISTAAEWC